jgi:hypothetical protein
VHGPVLYLLGSDVSRRTKDAARIGQPPEVAVGPRYPEIDQLEAADISADQEDVAWLDVAMDDPTGMGERERIGQLAQHRQALGEDKGTTRKARSEILALKPLHGQVVLARARDAMGDIPNDARVAKLSEDVGLSLKSLYIELFAAVQEFDGDRYCIEPVEGSKDRPHATCRHLPLENEAARDDGARTHAYGWRKTVMAFR